MIDVGAKPATARRARAQGKILMSPAAFAAVAEGTNPKGDVLAVAEVAGIQAAKRTAEWIPLCHPLPLDQVTVQFELLRAEYSIMVHCEAATTAKTGVEMEALCGVNAALLAIYDLSKAVDPVLTISDVRLNQKEGGKSGLWRHPEYRAPETSAADLTPLADVRAAVITVSDRCARGEAADRSGPELAALCARAGAVLGAQLVVPDDAQAIQRAVLGLVREQGVRLVLTTGGTGLSPRDVTPEALAGLFTKSVPGVGECLRSDGSRHLPAAWLSRSGAGLIDRALVVYLPGSPRAVAQAWPRLLELIPHALHVAEGGGHG